MLAKAPNATLYTEGSDGFVCLHRRSDCFRVERTQSRADFHPQSTSAFSRRT